MTSWEIPGAKCVLSVELKYLHDIECGTRPTISAGEILTVAGVQKHAIGVVIRFDGHPVDGWYNVRAFRPLINRTQEQDAEMFRVLSLSGDPIERAALLLEMVE